MALPEQDSRRGHAPAGLAPRLTGPILAARADALPLPTVLPESGAGTPVAAGASAPAEVDPSMPGPAHLATAAPPPAPARVSPRSSRSESPQEPSTIAGVDRVITAVITVAPVLLLGLAAWQAWNRELHWADILIFALMYVPIGLGVTVGFHRLLTHRSFKTYGWMRAIFAICGTMAIEGPVIDWVANHRRHHAYSDRPGDPHSPHVGHGEGVLGALRGLLYAHVGWLFKRADADSNQRFAPDLLSDPVIVFVDRTFIVWSLAGLAIPFGLGVLIGGSVGAGLTGLLWGGAVRMFVLHHVTYSINSLCHFFGSRRFRTRDHSRNLNWLAPLSFGEAWHNNHHAFPTSAFHGMRRGELDISGLLIATLERLGLAWEVQRIGAARQASRAIT